MSNIQVPVPAPVERATKAVVATVTTGLTWLGLFSVAIADGSVDWTEAGTLIGAGAGAVATIYGVWRVPNGKKPLQ